MGLGAGSVIRGACMIVLALDLARKTGFAIGDSAGAPESWSEALGPPKDVGAQCVGLAHQIGLCFRLRGVPQIACIERWMPIPGQRSDRNIESSLRLNGAAHAILGGIHGIRIVEASADTIRAGVCGRARAGDRESTKAMVIQVMRWHKFMEPDDPDDDNRADALAAWLWCAGVYRDVV
jgi:hypothetical protein